MSKLQVITSQVRTDEANRTERSKELYQKISKKDRKNWKNEPAKDSGHPKVIKRKHVHYFALKSCEEKVNFQMGSPFAPTGTKALSQIPQVNQIWCAAAIIVR